PAKKTRGKADENMVLPVQERGTGGTQPGPKRKKKTTSPDSIVQYDPCGTTTTSVKPATPHVSCIIVSWQMTRGEKGRGNPLPPCFSITANFQLGASKTPPASPR
ncbi:unnamed protein product, partial [Ectocarpus sp. 8 AP-2014]